MLRSLGRIFRRLLLEKARIRLERVSPKPDSLSDTCRCTYQQRYVSFHFEPSERILDIGSGAHPFPHANVLIDQTTGPTPHRTEPIKIDDRDFVIGDISDLPFQNRAFDFVYCSHVLEHISDPVKACEEIMRIGRKGYIEAPTFGKDALFAWTQEMHKWHVVAIADVLCFFEYSQRQLEGIRSSAWRDIIFDSWYHPLQEAFYENEDMFNVMFQWEGSFSVFVFHLDGSIKRSNVNMTSRR